MTRNRNWRSRSALLASVCIGCSFQNFDYMQKGSSTSSDTGGTAQDQGGGAGEGSGAGLSSGGLAEEAGRSTGAGASAGSSTAKAGNSGTGSGGWAGRGGTSSGGSGGIGASAGADPGAAGSTLAAGSDSGGASAGAGAGVAGAAGSSTFKPVLINSGFEATLTGWTVDAVPAAAKPYVFTQWPKPGATNIEGQYELSTWGDAVAFSVKIYQVVTGLVDGKYTFKGWFNRGDTVTAHLYTTGCGSSELQQNIPLTGVAQWVEVSISNFDVTGGQCTVGLFVDSPATAWLNADAFSFTYNP